MTKVSVIVPVYNVEKYLKKCLDSLIAQTIDNYEIILVDDGSPDNCGMICDEYASKYSNIRVIHQQNQGLSMARNNGIKKAKGKYLAFVDSDDFISKEMLEYLYNNCEKNNAEIGICNYNLIDEDNNVINLAKEKQDEILSAKETLRRLLYKKYDIDVISCNKIFKKELFNDISFPKGKLFEDYQTITKVISKSNKVFKTYKSFYYYLQRSNSINSINLKNKIFNKKSLDLIDAINEVEKYIKDFDVELLKEMIPGCIENKIGVANQIIRSNYKDKTIIKDIVKEINENKKYILKCNDLPFKDKYKIIIFKHLTLYKIIYKMYIVIKEK